MGISQNSFTRVIFQYKTYNFPNFQTCSFIGVLTLFDTKYLTDRQTYTHTHTDVLPVYIIVTSCPPCIARVR